MTNEELEELEILEELDKEISRNKLVRFIEHTHGNYDTQWFHETVCSYLDKLAEGEIKKLMIFIPPQHGKSEISSRRFPAYLLGKNPSYKIGIGSYDFTLATSFNRAIQQIMDDEKYTELFPETQLNSKTVSIEDRSGVIRNSTIFETVKYKGFVKTVSIGMGLTGTPLDIGIIDDPFKDRATANSPTMRNHVWDWYNDVFCTRLHNDSRQLLLFTRWHEDDLAGRLLDPLNEHYNEDEAKEWTVIALPALKEATKPLECALDVDDPREIDEALWENKHSAEKYKRRRQTNPTGFASLDQQRPAPLEGSKLLREWFVTKKPSELPFNLNDVKADFFIDGAFTEQTQNDETGLGSFYYHKQTNTLYILNVSGVRKELYELLPYFKQYVLLNQYKSSSNVFIELKASGHPLKSMLSKPEYGGFNCRAVPSKVVGLGKWNRVENAEPFLASGKVVLVEGSWNKAFIDQCCGFPNLVHDDLVDVLCYGVHHYFIKSDAGSGVSYED